QKRAHHRGARRRPRAPRQRARPLAAQRPRQHRPRQTRPRGHASRPKYPGHMRRHAPMLRSPCSPGGNPRRTPMTELLVLNDGKQEMQAVSLDGTRVPTLITGLDALPDGVVVDRARGHVYWTNMGAPDPGSAGGDLAYTRNG